MSRASETPHRPGTLGILLACLLVQLFVWRNHAGQAKAIEILKFGSAGCPTGKVQAGILATAEDYGILRQAGITIERPAVAQARLEAIKKASLARRLSLEAGKFNPFLLIVSLFAHVDWLHFALNAWILILAGSLMEGHWGTRVFLGVCAAGGVAGQVAFLVFGGLGGAGEGHTLSGLSGVIAALGVACLLTRDGSAVPYPAPWGVGSGVRVSPRLYLGLWAAALSLEALWLGGYSGGASLSALVAGGLAGFLLAKQVPGVLPRRPYGPAPIG
jgi:membrane associated rhomboid family serine protease